MSNCNFREVPIVSSCHPTDNDQNLVFSPTLVTGKQYFKSIQCNNGIQQPSPPPKKNNNNATHNCLKEASNLLCFQSMLFWFTHFQRISTDILRHARLRHSLPHPLSKGILWEHLQTLIRGINTFLPKMCREPVFETLFSWRFICNTPLPPWLPCSCQP